MRLIVDTYTVFMDKAIELSHGDPEAAHYEADEILKYVIREFGEQLDMNEEVEELLASYEKVDKWYA